MNPFYTYSQEGMIIHSPFLHIFQFYHVIFKSATYVTVFQDIFHVHNIVSSHN